MSSNGSLFVSFCSWSQRYCLAVICVGFICCLSWVASHPDFCDVYVVGSVMIIMITFSFYSTMGPQSSIFPLNWYSRPYGNRNIIYGSTLVFDIFCLPFY